MLFYVLHNTLLNNLRGIHMARAGVTYHDVAKAAEAIKSQRQEPTVDRVREHLGTGSKSTIAPLLLMINNHFNSFLCVLYIYVEN